MNEYYLQRRFYPAPEVSLGLLPNGTLSYGLLVGGAGQNISNYDPTSQEHYDRSNGFQPCQGSIFELSSSDESPPVCESSNSSIRGHKDDISGHRYSDFAIDTAIPSPMDHSSQTYVEGSELLAHSPPIELPLQVHTNLIEYWFTDICQMWSMFDSDTNLNRTIARDLWGSSELVFYAMESMSAACMVRYTPEMKKVLMSTTKRTLQTIQSRTLTAKFENTTGAIGFPTDLFFAIFAMGTSLHWSFDFQLGRSLIYDAQRLLQFYKMRLPNLDTRGRIHLKFFQQALICWESLVSAVDQAFIPTGLASRLKALQLRVDIPAGSEIGSTQQLDQPTLTRPRLGSQSSMTECPEPHPWCGMSTDVLEKFGQVLAICHTNSREKLDAGMVEGSSRNIMLARELQTELMALNFAADQHSRLNDSLFPITGDSSTPMAHLLDMAEAYRQASLLQLHLSFDNLAVPHEWTASRSISAATLVASLPNPSVTKREYLSTVSLRLLELLRRLPPHSGSRCMQPVLYLCAATGLQTIEAPHVTKGFTTEHTLRAPEIVATMLANKQSYDGTAEDQSGPSEQGPSQYHHAPDQQDSSSSRFTSPNLSLSVERGQARQLVASRLGTLQHSLPPGPSSTAIKLAEAIWREHDCVGHSQIPIHWFDVMVRKNLRTLFG